MRLLCIALLLWAGIAASGAEQRDIEYGQAAGERLLLDAWTPEGPGPFPAVILVHGGGWSAGDKSGGPRKGYMLPMHAPLERAGFAWFSINYRLAPKHPFPACIEDVETAIRWLKARAESYKIDRNRIAISGESAGAHLVALAAVRADERTRVAAVIPFYGVFDLSAMVERGAQLPPAFVALTGRQVADEDTLAVLTEASALPKVKRGLPPFLLVHGTADARVPLAQSEIFAAKLAANGVPNELIVVKDGIHGMVAWDAGASKYQERVVEWLRRTLPAAR